MTDNLKSRMFITKNVYNQEHFLTDNVYDREYIIENVYYRECL